MSPKDLRNPISLGFAQMACASCVRSRRRRHGHCDSLARLEPCHHHRVGIRDRRFARVHGATHIQAAPAGEVVKWKQARGAFAFIENGAGHEGWVKTGEVARIFPTPAANSCGRTDLFKPNGETGMDD